MSPERDPAAPEQTLKRWAARFVGSADSPAASGELVLTDRSIRFEPKRGLFARSSPSAVVDSRALETLDAAAPFRSMMRIGYGDKMVIEGATLAGRNYEFGRELSSLAFLTEMAQARRHRRLALGLPDDLAACTSCGRWVTVGRARCDICANSTPRPG